MRNAVLPFVPTGYDFGNNNYELQMFNENISGFCLDAKEFDNSNDNINKKQSLDHESFSFPIQSSQGLPYQLSSAFPQSATISGCDNIENMVPSHQNYSTFLGKKILAPQLEMKDFPSIRNTRKRPIEVNDVILSKIGISELFSDHRKLSLNSKNKKSKVTNNIDQEWKLQVRETLLSGNQGHKLKMPVKKSQKLTHKITALQKLVSPYGKTDTASVLQEASLYINLLQEQIQNLFRMLTSSYDSVKNPSFLETGKRRLELRGFCLVPISFTEEVSFMEERNVDPNKYGYH